MKKYCIVVFFLCLALLFTAEADEWRSVDFVVFSPEVKASDMMEMGDCYARQEPILVKCHSEKSREDVIYYFTELFAGDRLVNTFYSMEEADSFTSVPFEKWKHAMKYENGRWYLVFRQVVHYRTTRNGNPVLETEEGVQALYTSDLDSVPPPETVQESAPEALDLSVPEPVITERPVAFSVYSGNRPVIREGDGKGLFVSGSKISKNEIIPFTVLSDYGWSVSAESDWFSVRKTDYASAVVEVTEDLNEYARHSGEVVFHVHGTDYPLSVILLPDKRTTVHEEEDPDDDVYEVPVDEPGDDFWWDFFTDPCQLIYKGREIHLYVKKTGVEPAIPPVNGYEVYVGEKCVFRSDRFYLDFHWPYAKWQQYLENGRVSLSIVVHTTTGWFSHTIDFIYAGEVPDPVEYTRMDYDVSEKVYSVCPENSDCHYLSQARFSRSCELCGRGLVDDVVRFDPENTPETASHTYGPDHYCSAPGCTASEQAVSADESSHSFVGEWVLVQYTSGKDTVFFPSRVLAEVPSLTLSEDGKAWIVVSDGSCLEGTWDPDPDSGTAWLCQDRMMNMEMKLADGRITAKQVVLGAVVAELVFARKEYGSPEGIWEAIGSVSYGKDNFQEAYAGIENLTLIDGGSALLETVASGGKTLQHHTGRWMRKGNDIIFYLHSYDESESEILVPYRYYQLREGLLYQCRVYDDHLPVVHIRGSRTKLPDTVPVVSVKPLLNTSWIKYGESIKGYFVPADVLENAGSTIRFDDTGRCVISMGKQSAGGGYVLENGTLRVGSDEDNTVISLTADGCLILDGLYGTVWFKPLETEANVKLYSGEDWCPLDPVVLPKNKKDTATGGEKKQFTMYFMNADAVNKKLKNNAVVWSVTDENGLEIPGVSISQNGEMKVLKGTGSAVACVSATSVSFGTRGEYRVRILSDEDIRAMARAEKPVTELKLSLKNKVKSGSKVNIRAEVLPASAVDKSVEWSLENVDADIATISSKGQLSVSKDAPAGTVIVVVCKAVGAPEPIVEKLEIVVGE